MSPLGSSQPNGRKRSRSSDANGHNESRAAQRPKTGDASQEPSVDSQYGQGPCVSSPGAMEINDEVSAQQEQTPAPDTRHGSQPSSSPTAHHHLLHIHPSQGHTDPRPLEVDQSAAHSLPTPEPLPNPKLKARFQDAVRIIWRQVQLKRLASFFVENDGSASHRALCDRCVTLHLDTTSFVMQAGASFSETGKFYGGRRLGTLFDIYTRATTCPLCRLVIRSLSEHPYAKLLHIVASADQFYIDPWHSVTYKEHVHKPRRRPLNMFAFCTAQWTVDGRVTEGPNDSLSEPKPKHKTRRLLLTWSDPCFETAHIIMMEPLVPKGRVQTEFLGKYLSKTNRTKQQLISQWITKCSDEHGLKCRVVNDERTRFDDLRGQSYFGVIDVREMQLTTLPEGAPYVALSYNWGSIKDNRFKTTRKTVRDIKRPHGVSDYLHRLPTTIRQTFELVRSLNLRYVWIDSLCIVQDSPKAWDRNSIVMDLVYGNAHLTVCAADGKDAYAGLRALDHSEDTKYRRRTSQIIEEIRPGLNLMALYPCEIYVQKSKWSKRGWTFQERLLSKRCLIFTEGRMYFQCCSSTMSEDIDLETPKAGLSVDHADSPMEIFQSVAQEPVTAYMRNVRLYTERDLSDKSDILAAFYGIGKLISKHMGGELVYGLPSSHFDFALLWSAHDAPRRRQRGSRIFFPSWSWCGWSERYMLYRDDMVGDIQDDVHGWLMDHTWINWYIRDDSGTLRLVWDGMANDHGNDNLPRRQQGYSVENADSPLYDYYGRRIPSHLFGRERHEFKLTTSDFPIQVTTRPRGEAFSRLMGPTVDFSILQFWTWSAYLMLASESEVETARGDPDLGGRIFSRRYTIMDANRSLVGTIVLDPKSKFDKHKPQQFIAISDAKKFSPHEGMMEHYYTTHGKGPWSLYNVLMLGYDDPGDESNSSASESDDSGVDYRDNNIAYRLGLGKVYKEAFDHGIPWEDQPDGKMWREIVLG